MLEQFIRCINVYSALHTIYIHKHTQVGVRTKTNDCLLVLFSFQSNLVWLFFSFFVILAWPALSLSLSLSFLSFLCFPLTSSIYIPCNCIESISTSLSLCKAWLMQYDGYKSAVRTPSCLSVLNVMSGSPTLFNIQTCRADFIRRQQNPSSYSPKC